MIDTSQSGPVPKRAKWTKEEPESSDFLEDLRDIKEEKEDDEVEEVEEVKEEELLPLQEFHEDKEMEEVEEEELLPFHEFHSRDSARGCARSLQHHIGMKFGDYKGRDAVTVFFCRYTGCDEKDYSFDCTWRRGYCKAVLKTPSLGDRTFEGKWKRGSNREKSRHLAEFSAIDAFKADREVLEIAASLPPPITRIKEKIFLRKDEYLAVKAHGLVPTEVVRRMVHRVFLEFRELGCRTALWDGMAWQLDFNWAGFRPRRFSMNL